MGNSRMTPFLTYPYNAFLMVRLEYSMIFQDDLQAKILRVIESFVEAERSSIYRTTVNNMKEDDNEVLDIARDIMISISPALFKNELHKLVKNDNTLKRAINQLIEAKVIYKVWDEHTKYASPYYMIQCYVLQALLYLVEKKSSRGHIPAILDILRETDFDQLRPELQEGEEYDRFSAHQNLIPSSKIEKIISVYQKTIDSDNPAHQNLIGSTQSSVSKFDTHYKKHTYDKNSTDKKGYITDPANAEIGPVVLTEKNHEETDYPEAKQGEEIAAREDTVTPSQDTQSNLFEVSSEQATTLFPVAETPAKPGKGKNKKKLTSDEEKAAEAERVAIYNQLVARRGCELNVPADRRWIKKMQEQGHTAEEVDKHHEWHVTHDRRWNKPDTIHRITAYIIHNDWNATELAMQDRAQQGDTQQNSIPDDMKPRVAKVYTYLDQWAQVKISPDFTFPVEPESDVAILGILTSSVPATTRTISRVCQTMWDDAFYRDKMSVKSICNKFKAMGPALISVQKREEETVKPFDIEAAKAAQLQSIQAATLQPSQPKPLFQPRVQQHVRRQIGA